MSVLDQIPSLDRVLESLYHDVTKDDIIDTDIVSRKGGVAAQMSYFISPGLAQEKLFWLEDDVLKNEHLGNKGCCLSCLSERIMSLDAHARDSHHASLGDVEHHGYAPSIEGVCGGDGVWIELCLDCGQVQSDFPKETPEELLPEESEEK